MATDSSDGVWVWAGALTRTEGTAVVGGRPAHSRTQPGPRYRPHVSPVARGRCGSRPRGRGARGGRRVALSAAGRRRARECGGREGASCGPRVREAISSRLPSSLAQLLAVVGGTGLSDHLDAGRGGV